MLDEQKDLTINKSSSDFSADSLKVYTNRGTGFKQRCVNFLTTHRQANYSGLQRLAAKPLQTVIIGFVLGIIFATIALLWLLWGNFDGLQTIWQRNFEITLYLKPEISSLQSEKLVQQLRARSDVAQAHYISPAEGLVELQSRLKMDNVLEQLQQNPLPGVIVVEPVTAIIPGQALQRLNDSLQHLPQVDFTQMNEWVKQLAALLVLGKKLAYIITLLLLTSLWFAIYYTLHLVLSLNLEELQLFKSLGATPAFMRRPMLYAGAWYGALGALTGSILISILAAPIKRPLHDLATAFTGSFELKGLNLDFIAGLIMLGILLGWVSALLIIGKESEISH